MQQIARFYIETYNWKIVEEHVIHEDVLQKPTIATRKRIFSELLKRLRHLTDAEILYMANAPMDDVKVIAMLSAIKTYRLIREFITEVMRDKYFLFDYELLNSDYVSFIDSKQAQSDKLGSLSESTQKKLRQVMFNMFHEAGLITDTKRLVIHKPLLSEEAIKLTIADDPRLLSSFFMTESEINHYIEKYA